MPNNTSRLMKAMPIDRAFPLDQCVAAQAHMKANQHFGKIALVM